MKHYEVVAAVIEYEDKIFRNDAVAHGNGGV